MTADKLTEGIRADDCGDPEVAGMTVIDSQGLASFKSYIGNRIFFPDLIYRTPYAAMDKSKMPRSRNRTSI